MSIAGIVAEFNPFHNGHAALVAAARRDGAAYVVAAMGGSFAQRGEPAIADKFVRARCALAGGVDLVLELPLAYAAATAQRFARGAAALLQASGIVDTLAFGSEEGDIAPLLHLARAVDAPETLAAISPLLDRGLTFAKARQLAVEEAGGPEIARLLAYPNNTLAVEYIRQAHQLGWHPKLFTLPRQGAAHDALLPQDNTASASFLRRHPVDKDILCRHIPPPCADILEEAQKNGLYPADPRRLEIAMLAHLRRQSREALSALPDLSEGIENRLYAAIRSAGSLEELHSLIKTKRYTLARVRRLVLAAFLGLTQQDQDHLPAYIRVLGCRKESKALLGLLGKSARLPVGTALASLSRLTPEAKRQAELESLAGDLYTLALPVPRPCGYEYRTRIVDFSTF